MNHSMPGLPVHHQLPEFTHTHVHWVGDAIQPSHPLSSPSPPAPNPSQHQTFPMSQLFTWGGQITGVSASASFLPKKSQGWSPSEWTGWISLQSEGLSRVFSNTTVQKSQFFGAQLSSQSNFHIQPVSASYNPDSLFHIYKIWNQTPLPISKKTKSINNTHIHTHTHTHTNTYTHTHIHTHTHTHTQTRWRGLTIYLDQTIEYLILDVSGL